MTALQPGVLEGQTLTQDLNVSCDVCIIGSGAGGATTAAVLAQAGLHVVVVEEGGYFTQNRFRMREEEAFPYLYQEGAQRASKDLSVGIYQGKAVGGGTVVNWTTCFRLPEHTLAHWHKHHGVQDLTANELIPHYEQVEHRLNIHKVGLDEINRNNRLLYDGCKALGWEVDTLKRNVRGCARTGYCGLGCPIDAKQSALVTTLPDAMRHGATVISRCRVEKLVTEGSTVTTLEGTFLDGFGRAPTGQVLKLKAKHFVLSAGAIGSPSVLLRSGIASSSGLTGKRTFLHPVTGSAGVFDEEVAGYHGAPQGAASHQFAHRGDDVGYFMEATPLQPLFAASGLGGLGAAHRAQLEKLPQLQVTLALTIDGFHDGVPGGTVELDSDGAPRLDYVVQPKQWEALREASKSMAKMQFAAGAKEVKTLHEPTGVMKSPDDIDRVIDRLPYEANKVFVASAHQMGGCPMSDNKATGVVRSADLRHHDVENLHVMDGSVFPTSLGVNPQLSIYGVTHRTASRLAQAWT